MGPLPRNEACACIRLCSRELDKVRASLGVPTGSCHLITARAKHSRKSNPIVALAQIAKKLDIIVEATRFDVK